MPYYGRIFLSRNKDNCKYQYLKRDAEQLYAWLDYSEILIFAKISNLNEEYYDAEQPNVWWGSRAVHTD